MQFPVTHKDCVEGLAEIEEAASKGGVPVGHIYFSLEKTVPTGSLPLNGGTYAHLAYIDLWNYILEQGNYLTFDEWQAMYDANDGNVPFYAITRSGSQSQWRFRVPSINGWVKGASSLEEVGSYLEAGLPNITGELRSNGFGLFGPTEVTLTGVFTGDTNGQRRGGDGSSTFNPKNLQFNASNCSSIYGNSDTVQPPSIVGMWLVKAFGTVSNVGNQDIADISAGLARVENKMDEYTDNVAYIDAFLVETWRSDDDLSWYRKYSDGWIEQGGDLQGTTKNESRTVTLPTAFSNTKYTLICSLEGSGSTSNDAGSAVVVRDNKTTTAFIVKSTDDTSNYLGTWYACGY
jgi:hypothetical protein